MSSKRRPKRAPTERIVPLPDGRRLTVWRWPGRGTPLVLLHGVLDSGRGWDGLARTTGRPCLAFDLPGFGASDLPTRPRISAYAEDVLAALDALRIHRYVLVGHSLGGAVATAMCERRGDEVSALVLMAPAGFGRIRLAELVSVPGVRDVTALLLPLALSNSLALNVAYSTMVSNRGRMNSATLERVKARASESVDGAREATRAVVAAGASRNAFHRRRVRYYGPVTVLWGDRDRIVPMSHAAAVRKALPQAHVDIWPGMGHHPQHENPRRLRDYIERACGTRRGRGGAASARAA